MKGVSPLIATVLLIAFTVAIAGIISTWITSFTQSSTGTVEERGNEQLTCSFGHIAFSDLKYCSSRIAGIVENTGMVALGNITIQVLYNNATSIKHLLNISLEPGEMQPFNVTANGNYDWVIALTNCTDAKDKARTGEVSLSC